LKLYLSILLGKIVVLRWVFPKRTSGRTPFLNNIKELLNNGVRPPWALKLSESSFLRFSPNSLKLVSASPGGQLGILVISLNALSSCAKPLHKSNPLLLPYKQKPP
jgi:hypothetical protein